MKNVLIAGLACLVAAFAFGVEPLLRVTNEAMNRGTLRGVEKCVGYSASELLSDDAIKATCTRKFEKRLFHRDHANGRAGPRFDRDVVFWEGVMENDTSDHLTTWVRISVGVLDEEGKEQVFRVEAPIWIDPLGEQKFSVEVPDLKRGVLEDLEFCDRKDDEPKSCMLWDVVAVKGLSL